jgi:DNA helicase II / ATP-dependent DNA helicase PcrA
MFSKLSFSQKRIVVCQEPRIIVKACPGSGKTYSVTARLARLLQSNKLSEHQGIAVLSFTNNACDEIGTGLKENFGINNIGYPNFVGTIDSFVNNYIFLPFGHLEMHCTDRPEIVGTEYNKWFEYDAHKKNYDQTKIIDPDYFFDKVSFHDSSKKERVPIRLIHASCFDFSWGNITNKDGAYCKKIKDIISSKDKHFRLGKANQADANYFANRILMNYPLIPQSLARKFPIIIIDEAQDTTEIQMSIIDILDKNGVKCLMLIGDPDQAIFEWNTANAELFIEKWANPDWFQLELKENRRCSTNICNVLNNFFHGEMISVSKYKDYVKAPIILGHDSNNDSILSIYCKFIDKCTDLSIPEDNIAVVYRGNKFGETYFGIADRNTFNVDSPWVNKYYYVRDITYGKYLIEKGILKDGYKLIEKGYNKWESGLAYISSKYLKEKVNREGYKKYRGSIFNFLDELPEISEKDLNTWITEIKEKLGYDFKINSGKGNILISSLFHGHNDKDLPSYINTIHSVKGKSLDAILVFLKKDSATKDYKNLLNTNLKKDKKDMEEIRVVYVACSRPRKLLWIAVPNQDVELWKTFLQVQNLLREY